MWDVCALMMIGLCLFFVWLHWHFVIQDFKSPHEDQRATVGVQRVHES
jgi:hypothetical protein